MTWRLSIKAATRLQVVLTLLALASGVFVGWFVGRTVGLVGSALQLSVVFGGVILLALEHWASRQLVVMICPKPNCNGTVTRSEQLKRMAPWPKRTITYRCDRCGVVKKEVYDEIGGDIA